MVAFFRSELFAKFMVGFVLGTVGLLSFQIAEARNGNAPVADYAEVSAQ